MSKIITQVAIYKAPSSEETQGKWEIYPIGVDASASTITADNVSLNLLPDETVFGATNVKDAIINEKTEINALNSTVSTLSSSINALSTTVNRLGSNTNVGTGGFIPGRSDRNTFANFIGSTNISASSIGLGDGTITGAIKDIASQTKNFFDTSLSVSSRKYIGQVTVTLPKGSTSYNGTVGSTFAPKYPGLYFISAQCEHSAGPSDTMRESGLRFYSSYQNPGLWAARDIGNQRTVKSNNNLHHNITGFYNVTQQEIDNNDFFAAYGAQGSASNASTSHFSSSLTYIYFHAPIDVTNTYWILKEENINLSNDFDYSLNFRTRNASTGPVVTRIVVSDGILTYYFQTGDPVVAYNENGWTSDNLRIMVILGGNDVKNQSFVDWLQNNATQQ